MRLPELGPGYIPPRIPEKLLEHYQVYMDTAQWRTLRRKVLKRAKKICEMCVVVSPDARRLAKHVHHVTYERLFFERMTDLLAVCFTCHAMLHPSNEHLADLTSGDELLVMMDGDAVGSVRIPQQPKFDEPVLREPNE